MNSGFEHIFINHSWWFKHIIKFVSTTGPFKKETIQTYVYPQNIQHMSVHMYFSSPVFQWNPFWLKACMTEKYSNRGLGLLFCLAREGVGPKMVWGWVFRWAPRGSGFKRRDVGIQIGGLVNELGCAQEETKMSWVSNKQGQGWFCYCFLGFVEFRTLNAPGRAADCYFNFNSIIIMITGAQKLRNWWSAAFPKFSSQLRFRTLQAKCH